jgi:predicted NAD/FAD-binding protein
MKKQKIAIIGSGISGISCAYYLQEKYDITLFEKRERLGGHTNTFEIKSEENKGLLVDTGFIVLNDKTYPNLHKFFKDLNVKVRFSDMSFSYHSAKNSFAYAGTGLKGLFANNLNIFNLNFWKFLFEIKRFSKQALIDLENDSFNEKSLGNYLNEHKFSNDLINYFILPMGAAIWSTPAVDMLKFPAKTFIYFFKNHGLLSIKDRPRWQTVVGGSSAYIKAFKNNFKGKITLNAEINSIERRDDKIFINQNGKELEFDKVVIAVHGNQVLGLLKDPTNDEVKAYGSWEYNKNRTILHSDRSVLPKNKKLWASWVYYEDQEGKLSVSYHMNRLQGFNTNKEFIVSLNIDNIDPKNIYYEVNYEHPLYTNESIKSQEFINKINGDNNTYFAGAYLGYGFHEDGIKSALSVMDKM